MAVSRHIPVQGRSQINEATAGLFENSCLPMWIYDLRTLSFLAVNDAAVECYGYSRNWLHRGWFRRTAGGIIHTPRHEGLDCFQAQEPLLRVANELATEERGRQ